MNPDKLPNAIQSLVDLVERLRGPDGCPWDKKQTDSTIILYLLEEAYELLDAIQKSSPEETCLELGDLLFHILFLARLAEERNQFDLIEVIEKITQKMVRRHPHIFGDAKADTAEDVVENWAKIKQKEQNFKNESADRVSYLNNVPKVLPALMRAHRLSEKASGISDRPSTPAQAWEMTLRGFEALKRAVDAQDKVRFGREIGDCLFGLANLARLWGLNGEKLLMAANERFIDAIEKTQAELELQ